MRKNKLFGTDGIRGTVGQEPITPEGILKLGWAAGRVFVEQGKARNKVIIGKDTRVSGYLLESALEAGLAAAGADVSLLGPMPTPAIAYLTRTARANCGIVISASHNIFSDNGIKFFSADGLKLSDDIEDEIEKWMAVPLQTVEAEEMGRAERFSAPADRYIEYCKHSIPHNTRFSNLKLVIDCANGATYHIAPHVFTELGADVCEMSCNPNGLNINDDCGSTAPQKLVKKVLEVGADAGIGLDGDGDRLVMVDHSGEVLNGDQILNIISSRRHRTGAINGGVIGTLLSNLGLEHSLKAKQIPFIRTQVGDRFIIAELAKQGWKLGGEPSGHIICFDKSTTGDGIVAALEVVLTMFETGKTLSTLNADMLTYPQASRNFKIDPSNGRHHQVNSLLRKIRENQQFSRMEDQLRKKLQDRGRIVIRGSGTEPLIRIMVEGEDRQEIETICDELRSEISRVVRLL